MQKRFLYALFLCFTLNGMSPAHAQTSSFLTTIKGYITSIKEYAAGIYKHITGTNMLIGGATLAASALIANYFYASKQRPKECFTIPITVPADLNAACIHVYKEIILSLRAAYYHINSFHIELAQQELTTLKKLLQDNPNILKKILPYDQEIQSQLLETTASLRGTDTSSGYIVDPFYTVSDARTEEFKPTFALIYDCARLLQVSLPIDSFIIKSLYIENKKIPLWLISQYPNTKKRIEAITDPKETGFKEHCNAKIGMLHELIRNGLNKEAKKFIADGADLELQTNAYHNIVIYYEDKKIFYETPFIYAVAYNNLEMVKLLFYLNRPSEQDIKNAQTCVKKRVFDKKDVDQQIKTLLENYKNITQALTTAEQQEFNQIKQQRNSPSDTMQNNNKLLGSAVITSPQDSTTIAECLTTNEKLAPAVLPVLNDNQDHIQATL